MSFSKDRIGPGNEKRRQAFTSRLRIAAAELGVDLRIPDWDLYGGPSSRSILLRPLVLDASAGVGTVHNPADPERFFIQASSPERNCDAETSKARKIYGGQNK